MHIAVGSLNPIKQQAAQAVLGAVFPHSTFTAVAVPSGVPEQPWGDDQTRTGAYNRALAARTTHNADFGVGLEGGVVETDFGLMTNAWCAIIDRSGTVGVGGGSHTMLPPAVADMLRSGRELGEAMDAISGLQNTKQSLGAIGILTDGLSSRQQAYEVIVRFALARFRQPDLY